MQKQNRLRVIKVSRF